MLTHTHQYSSLLSNISNYTFSNTQQYLTIVTYTHLQSPILTLYDIVACVPQTGFAVAAMLPGLLRTHRRVLSDTPANPLPPSGAVVASGGHLDDVGQSATIAENAEEKNPESSAGGVASDALVRQRDGVGGGVDGVAGSGGGEGGEGEPYGIGGGGIATGIATGDATDSTMSDACADGKGKGLAEAGQRIGDRLDFTGEDSSAGRSVADEGGSSTKGGNVAGTGKGEAGRLHHGLVDADIPGRDPTFSSEGDGDATGGTGGRDNDANPLSDSQKKGLAVRSERQGEGEGAAVSEPVLRNAAGNAGKTGNVSDEVLTDSERLRNTTAQTSAAASSSSSAAAGAEASVPSSSPGSGSETLGEGGSAAGQTVDAFGGLYSAQSASSYLPTQEAESATTVDSASGEGAADEEQRDTLGKTQSESYDEGDIVRSEGEDGAGNANDNEQLAKGEGNASTPPAEKPPVKSTWGWGLPAWAGGGKNNGAR